MRKNKRQHSTGRVQRFSTKRSKQRKNAKRASRGKRQKLNQAWKNFGGREHRPEAVKTRGEAAGTGVGSSGAMGEGASWDGPEEVFGKKKAGFKRSIDTVSVLL